MQTDPGTGLTCGSCTTANAADARFCWKCYTPFPGSASGLPAPPSAAPAPTGLSSAPGLGRARMPAPQAPARKHRSRRGLIYVTVLIVVAVVGALSATSFEMPESIGGVPRMHDAVATEYEDAIAEWASNSGGLHLQGAVYGTGVQPDFIVGAVDEDVINDPDDILRVVVGSITMGGKSVATLFGQDGFEYRCVQATGQMSVCVWKESGNAGFVGAIGRTPQQTLEVTRTVRQEIES